MKVNVFDVSELMLVWQCRHSFKSKNCKYTTIITQLTYNKLSHSTGMVQLRLGLYVTRGSQSFTCLPHTNLSLSVLPAARYQCPLAGSHCAYPRRDGQAELTWVAGYILG